MKAKSKTPSVNTSRAQKEFLISLFQLFCKFVVCFCLEFLVLYDEPLMCAFTDQTSFIISRYFKYKTATVY